MKRIALATVVMFVTGLTAATAANWWETPEYVEADHVYTMDYVTPHVQWAKPLPGGKVRALFFISSKSSPPREIAEMCQRGDIEPSIVYYDRSGKTVQDGQVGMERAVRVIKQGPDVFVFANCAFESLSGEAQYHMMRQVIEEGAGIVCVGRTPKIAFTDERAVELPDHLQIGLPLASLPMGRAMAEALGLEDPAHADLAEAIMKRYRLGKGRELAISYPTGNDALTPRMSFSFEALAEYEYWAAFALKSILWASGRDTEFVFSDWPERDVVIDRADLPNAVSFSVEAPGAAQAQYVAASLIPLNGLNLVDYRRESEAVRGKLNMQMDYDLPVLTAGLYALDVTTGDPRGADNFGAIVVRITSERGVQSVELDAPFAERGETISGTATLRGDSFPAGETLMVRLRDAEDRVIAQQSLPAAPQVVFEFEVPEQTTILMRAEAALVDAEGDIDRAYANFRVPDRKRGQFHFLMWDYPRGPIGYWAMRSMRDNGVTSILSGSAPAEEIAANDLAYVPYTTRILEKYDENGIMQPACWNDEATIVPHVQEIVDKSVAARQHGVYCYSLGDENHTRGACQSEACLAAYREWLRGQYQDIAALNASWDSEYASFDEVSLYKAGDLNEQAAFNDGHYSRWYDRQAFKRYNYAVYCGRYSRAFKTIDPKAVTGFEGAGRFGDDYDECIAQVGFWGPYPSIGDDIIRSLAPPELITSNWMGYSREALPMVQKMWRMITNRNHGVWWWRWDNIGRFHGFMAPDMHPWDDTSQPVVDEMRDIRDGVGNWILAAEMPHDGIGLLYSMPSAFAGGQAPRRGNELDVSHRSFLEVVQDLGFAAHYLSDRTVAEDNDLNDGDERVLLLPMGRGMSDAVAEEVRMFVTAGGLVIADYRPAIRDEHCNLREAGALDDVFGIAQSPDGLDETASREFVIDDEIGGQHVKAVLDGRPDADVTITTGEALAGEAGVPLVIVNHFGDGTAVLLNFPFTQYLGLRDQGLEMPLRTLIGAALEMAEVRPVLKHSAGRGALRATETVRWQSGDTQLICLFKTAGEDGPATTALPEPMHVYDLRDDKYLGKIARIKRPLRVGYTNLYALTPERIGEMTLTAEPASVTPGDAVEVTARVRGADQGSLPVKARVFRPDGVEETWPTRELLTDGGRARFTLAVPFNAMPGTWRITARNVFTGQTAEAALVVE